MREKVRFHLIELQKSMQKLSLWQAVPPSEQALSSLEPFAIDTLEADEWLQWIFVPRMYALLDANERLPHQMAITPYIEEALKELDGVQELLRPISEIEKLCQSQT